MQIATWILWQLLSYGMGSWLVFVLIASCAARYGGYGSIFAGHLVVAAIVIWRKQSNRFAQNRLPPTKDAVSHDPTPDRPGQAQAFSAAVHI